LGQARNDRRSQSYVEWTLDGLLRHVVYLGGSPQPASLCRDLIPVRLAPSILVDDIGESDTANRPELAHRISDRQQSYEWTPGGNPRAASASSSKFRYSVVRVAPRPSARAASSMF
jgi:hypothetical protein